MSNELVKRDEFANALVDVDNTKKVVAEIMKTKHYAKMGEEGVYAIVAKAKSLHIDPMLALNGGLYYVQGRVGMQTELMASLIRQQGHSITMDERSNPTCCILRGRRKDTGDTWISKFSIEDAKRAGIYKPNGPWEKYGDVMCYNRAMSKLARQLWPDLIQGTGYTQEELIEISSKDYTVSSVNENLQKINVDQKINAEQVAFLEKVLVECDPKYVSLVKRSMKSEFGIDSYNDLTLDQHQRILFSALNNREVWQEKKQEELAKNSPPIPIVEPEITAEKEQMELFGVNV